jgi:ADP-ribosylglycohydrolase
VIVLPTSSVNGDPSANTDHAQTRHDRVLGCWLGKSIGGTLGAPDEGRQTVLNVSDYPPLNGEPLPNDDLDLQLVWLNVLERHGLATDAHVLSRAWLEHVRFPYGEYGYAIRNLRRGFLPPVTGAFDNPFTNGMGSPIRTEIWAIAAMGNPYLAAALAYEDAIVDHAGESIWGSIFFAALETAAFECADPDALLDLALGLIPSSSKLAGAVGSVRADHRAGCDWLEARRHVLERYGNFDDFTDAPQNIAFAVIGWLYGADFSDAVLTTVNCGFDTDSSGAMVGALMGILHGASGIPKRWTAPLGERVVVSPEVGGFDAPPTLEALTRRSMDVATLVDWQLRADTTLARAMRERATPEGIRALWQASNRSVTWRASHTQATASGLEVRVTYVNGPAVTPHERLELHVTLHNRSGWPWSGAVKLIAPKGWQGLGDTEITLAAESSITLEFSLSTTDESSAGSVERHVARLELARTISGVVWQKVSYPVAVQRRQLWQVVGANGVPRAVWLEGGLLSFTADHDGEVVARTTVWMPQRTPVRVVAMSKTPVHVRLADRDLFSTDGIAPFFPSPHITRHEGFERAYHDVTLEAGEHVFELRYPALRADGQPNHPDFRLGSLDQPLYHHLVDWSQD